MLNCGLLNKEELSRVPADQIIHIGQVSVFADDDGNEFVVYKVSPEAYIVI